MHSLCVPGPLSRIGRRVLPTKNYCASAMCVHIVYTTVKHNHPLFVHWYCLRIIHSWLPHSLTTPVIILLHWLGGELDQWEASSGQWWELPRSNQPGEQTAETSGVWSRGQRKRDTDTKHCQGKWLRLNEMTITISKAQVIILRLHFHNNFMPVKARRGIFYQIRTLYASILHVLSLVSITVKWKFL